MAYITRVQIEHCRNVGQLDVDLSFETLQSPGFPGARHLILTGPNGSGKSSVLRAIAGCLDSACMGTGDFHEPNSKERLGNTLLTFTGAKLMPGGVTYAWCSDTQKSAEVNRDRSSAFHALWSRGDVLLAYIPPRNRQLEQTTVIGVRKLDISLEDNRPGKTIADRLWQFLVNKYTDMIFAKNDGDVDTADRIQRWFDDLRERLRELMEDPGLDFRYDRKSYTFVFTRSDGYEYDLNSLADGHAAVFGLLAEVFIRIELLQSTKNDFTLDPEGIVIIDEIEAHLHLSLQEQILPLLTRVFPRLQFIVATHSPAVIASIPDAVVYDLKKQRARMSDSCRGVPYGELMTEHFGISSDIDLDSTGKLLRLRELAQKSPLSNGESNEFNQIESTLVSRSSVLATEVWMIKEKLSASSIQLAGG